MLCVIEVCECLLFLWCLCGVCGICRCESGMCVLIVWLIIFALTTVTASVQGQECHFGEISDTNYAHLAQNQSKNSSKSLMVAV